MSKQQKDLFAPLRNLQFIDRELVKPNDYNPNKVLEKNPKGGLLYYSSLFKYKSIWFNPLALVKTSLRLLQCFIYLCLP